MCFHDVFHLSGNEKSNTGQSDSKPVQFLQRPSMIPNSVPQLYDSLGSIIRRTHRGPEETNSRLFGQNETYSHKRPCRKNTEQTLRYSLLLLARFRRAVLRFP